MKPPPRDVVYWPTKTTLQFFGQFFSIRVVVVEKILWTPGLELPEMNIAKHLKKPIFSQKTNMTLENPRFQ